MTARCRLLITGSAALCAALPACFLDSSAYDTGRASTGAAGMGETSTSTAGGAAGAMSGSGASSTGAAGGSGGSAGSAGSGAAGAGGSGTTTVVEGDVCPGIPVALVPNNPVILQGKNYEKDGIALGGEYGSKCGGGMSPELVYAVTAPTKGVLHATFEPVLPYEGLAYLRTECEKAAKEVTCWSSGEQQVIMAKDEMIFVFVDGHAPNPTGDFKLTLFLDACGNGTIDPGEECDSGNQSGDDKCSPDCAVLCTAEQSAASYSAHFIHPKTHHCYLEVFDGNKNWTQASDDCAAWGGYLAALTDTQEIADLGGLISQNIEHCWIGAGDAMAEGAYAWLSGEMWSYPPGQPPWQDGEPNGGAGENCIEIYSSGRINDEVCTSSQNYLCERPPSGMAP